MEGTDAMTDTLRLRNATVEWRELDGEVVALECGRSVYLSANPAGTLLWRRLAEGTTRDELVGVLRERYSLAEERAQRDVDAFLATARAHGLLE
jgi:hypothetical protein